MMGYTCTCNRIEPLCDRCVDDALAHLGDGYVSGPPRPIRIDSFSLGNLRFRLPVAVITDLTARMP